MNKKNRHKKSKAAMNRRKENKFAIFSITIVVAMLLSVLAIDGAGLMKKQNEYAAQEKELQTKIDAENKRTEDLKEFDKYTKTKKYAEEIAKEKLGLVYGDEIVFKADDSK